MAEIVGATNTQTANNQRVSGMHRMVMFRAKIRAKKKPKASREAVWVKIKHLRAEGKSQSQAVATALSTAREGRLGPKGGYRR